MRRLHHALTVSGSREGFQWYGGYYFYAYEWWCWWCCWFADAAMDAFLLSLRPACNPYIQLKEENEEKKYSLSIKVPVSRREAIIDEQELRCLELCYTMLYCNMLCSAVD
jgi:hypothetical protein